MIFLFLVFNFVTDEDSVKSKRLTY